MDLRIAAFALVLLSSIAGLYLPTFTILGLTIIFFLIAILILCKESKIQNHGTSGGLGLLILCLGFIVFTVVPMWFANFIRSLT